MVNRQLVDDVEWLFRRGYAKHVDPFGNPTSRVFKLRDSDNGELSVSVKRLTTPEECIGDASKFNLFEIQNSDVSTLKLVTLYDPCPGNDAHAVIIGLTLEDDTLPGELARRSKRVYLAHTQQE